MRSTRRRRRRPTCSRSPRRASTPRRTAGSDRGRHRSSWSPTYFRHIRGEDLLDRAPTEIATDVAKHLKVAAVRPQGTAVIRVRTPDPRPDGEALPSVIEIVTDDMPFIVDSVTMELSRSGHAIQLVIHPQLVVRRDVTGALRGLATLGDTHDGSAGEIMAESWMRVEIDRVTDPDERRAHRGAPPPRAPRRPRGGRGLAEDAGRRRSRVADELDRVAAGRAARRGGVRGRSSCSAGSPTTTSRSSATASTSSSDAGRRPAIAAVPGSGLGILRADQVQLDRARATCAPRYDARPARSSC